MDNIEKRYEKKGTLKPCHLDKDDLVNLAGIIQDTFTKPEIDRYFRVSTTIGDSRVFANSMEDFLKQKELSPKFNELSFWMEGWGEKTRFDKNILLDFSKYSILLSVEGIDPVWVHDKYLEIIKYLTKKTSWYSPLITLERLTIFAITIILISNIIVSLTVRETLYYVDKIILLGIWIFLVFYDTRKILPYSNIRLRDDGSIFNKENIFTFTMIIVLIATIIGGTILPFFKK